MRGPAVLAVLQSGIRDSPFAKVEWDKSSLVFVVFVQWECSPPLCIPKHLFGAFVKALWFRFVVCSLVAQSRPFVLHGWHQIQ